MFKSFAKGFMGGFSYWWTERKPEQRPMTGLEFQLSFLGLGMGFGMFCALFGITAGQEMMAAKHGLPFDEVSQVDLLKMMGISAIGFSPPFFLSALIYWVRVHRQIRRTGCLTCGEPLRGIWHENKHLKGNPQCKLSNRYAEMAVPGRQSEVGIGGAPGMDV